MREFKPMVKMETTEPTVELKLKKGGAVEKKMARGGAPMGAMIGAPKGGMMVGAKPKKPSLAARRRAMMASGAAGAPSGRAEAMMSAIPAMKKGGRAKGGEMESPKVHKAEMKQLSGLKKELTKHEEMPASKGHRGLKTGGVVNGNGGFKTGGVAMANAGGFRKGGATKKFAEGGRVQKDGGPEQMPQGKKKPAGPVSINRLSGTYKFGGAVMMAAQSAAKKIAENSGNSQQADNKTASNIADLAQNTITKKFSPDGGGMKAGIAGAAQMAMDKINSTKNADVAQADNKTASSIADQAQNAVTQKFSPVGGGMKAGAADAVQTAMDHINRAKNADVAQSDNKTASNTANQTQNAVTKESNPTPSYGEIRQQVIDRAAASRAAREKAIALKNPQLVALKAKAANSIAQKNPKAAVKLKKRGGAVC